MSRPPRFGSERRAPPAQAGGKRGARATTVAGRAVRGFTLIELMIGVAIGALATLVIAQVFAFAEGQRRTTAGGMDAQVNGALALFALQRDAQVAGYGMTSSLAALGCEIRAQYNGVDYTWSLAPVVIGDGANGDPDTLQVMYSADNRYSLPTRVVVDHPRTAANFFVNSTLGLAEGDLMIAVPQTIDAANWCSVFNITGLGAGGGGGNGKGGGQGQNQVIHNSGNAGPWNQPGGQTIFPAAGYPAGSYLLRIGRLVTRTYSVTGGQALQLQELTTLAPAAPTTESLYANIVNLQAYYGKDTDADGIVDAWNTTVPTDNAGWRQVRALRLAVVARSAQFEKEDVTAADLQWDVGTAAPVAGATTCGSSACVTLKVSHLPDWRRYRYKMFETVVPVRNLLWHS